MYEDYCTTGGGTAGHVMPNLALIPQLEKHFEKIIYIGTASGIEKKLVENYKNVQFKEIEATKLIRKISLKNLAIPFRLMKSISEAAKILKEVNPNIVFSKGGYVSVPVAIAAWKLKIPVITHESDLSLGLANKIISKFSVLTLTSFKETTKNKKKYIHTGSPIREQIFKGDPKNLNYMLSPQKKNLLILGGSLGSQAINQVIADCLDELTNKYNVLHITGKGKLLQTNVKDYHSVEYVNNIEDYFAAADLVVSRAGANVLFELLALSKPTLFIPLPKAESRGDQIDNAKYFYNKTMCELLLQEGLNKNSLLSSINKLEKNSKILINNLQKLNLNNSNKKIIEIILKNIKNKEK
jgi:UDP-N-acetylglucosamine--N-acetylmuramyl-(pentapeptide) pyrophosphoryl-undecaprenol N-acetylglucosamine transferase